MRAVRFLPVILVVFLMHCASPQPDAPLVEAPVALNWQVGSHLEVPNTFSSTLTLTNQATTPLKAGGWTLYFNFIRMIDTTTVSDQVRITHINGDFFKLEPTASFPELAQGASTEITFRTAFWAVKKSDAPAGFYMVYTDAEGQALPPQPVRDYTVGVFQNAAQTMRSPADVLPVPTPASRYRDNENLSLLPVETLPPVVPTPSSWSRGDGSFEITGTTIISHAPGLESEAAMLATIIGQGLAGTAPEVIADAPDAAIRISIDEEMPGARQEAYQLSIDNSGIAIVGADAAGVFYGVQSLRALVPVDFFSNPAASIVLPAITISDGPRFPYRGLHVDVARNFHTKESILQVLDLMGFYKLNKFHFHLTDDEGWRLAINGLPELTEVGGRRGHTLDESTHLYPSLGSGPDADLSNGSGYYSREDFIEILTYAADRHIEVIPEIDVPGHARAAIRAMEARYNRLASRDMEEATRYRLIHPEDTSTYASVQMWNDNVIDVCQPSTYAFLEKVIDDVVAMYSEAGLTLKTVHIGNDEVPKGVWEGSPACQALDTRQYNDHFLRNMSAMLNSRSLNLAGWEEIALTQETAHGSGVKVPNPAFVDSNFRPYVWNAVWGWGSEGTAYTLANAGYEIVLANATNLYFDFAYDKDPEEPGFYWAGFVNTQKAFSFNPYDLYQNAETALFGQPIDAATVYRDFPRLTASGRQNIMGIQGQLWSESAKGAALLEYQLFPKVLGLAERAWAAEPAWVTVANEADRKAAEQAGWNVFANQIGQRELPRLDALWGIGYRIPPPGVRMDGASTVANVAFPGLTLRYTTAQRLPTAEDPVYTGPVPFVGQINIAAFSSNGRSSRAASLGANPLGD